MARPSKLSPAQCERIQMLKAEGVAAPQLAKRFKISESSIYKILNGSYVAGEQTEAALPPIVGSESRGATPSLFTKARESDSDEMAHGDQQVSSRVNRAADAASRDATIDETTLAAAELIIAQARYLRSRSHTG
jgi:hypothetical protein